MTSTTSQPNKKSGFSSMFSWTLKRNLTVTLVYSILMFISFPLVLFWTASSQYSLERQFNVDELNEFVKYFYPLTSVIVCAFALIIAGLVFNYLHNKRSVDLYNSFPLNRKSMYLSKFFAGLFIVTVPIIAAAVIAAVPAAFFGVDVVSYIIPNTLLILFSGAATYTFTAFLCACSGKTTDAIILSMGLSASFPLAIFVSNALFTSWVPGFSVLFEIPIILYLLLTPESISIASVYGYNMYNNGLSGDLLKYLLYFVLFTALFAFAGYYTYKKRRMECAQTEFSFKLPANIIRFIITYTVGIILSAFFTVISSSGDSAVAGHIWFWVGILFGAFAAHIILEAILTKGLKQLKKSMMIYLLVLAFTAAAYIFSITGFFGSYAFVPSAENVKSVSINGYVPTINFSIQNEKNIGVDSNEYDAVTIDDKEYIKEVMSVHNGIISEVNENKVLSFAPGHNSTQVGIEYGDDGIYFDGLDFTYTLTNGKEVHRHYYSNDFFSKAMIQKARGLIYSRKYIEADIYRISDFLENISDSYKHNISLMVYSYDEDKGILYDLNCRGITGKQASDVLMEIIKEMSSDKKTGDLLQLCRNYNVDKYYTIEIESNDFFCTIDLPSSFTDISDYIFSKYGKRNSYPALQ